MTIAHTAMNVLLICYTKCAHPVINVVPVDGVVDQV